MRILSPPSPGQRILGTPLSLVVAVLGLLALLSPFGQAEQPGGESACFSRQAADSRFSTACAAPKAPLSGAP